MFKLSVIQFTLIFIYAYLQRKTDAANVLCMYTCPGKTQLMIFMAVANTLIDRGHNVTIVTTIPIPPQSENKKHAFRHVLLTQPIETINKLNDEKKEMVDEAASKYKIAKGFIFAAKMFTTIQKDALTQEQFQSFFKEENHFDLMILGYFHNEFMVGVAARYKCPIAIISLSAPYSSISQMIGNPDVSSYVQLPIFGKSQLMTFMERMQNFFWRSLEPVSQLYADYKMGQIYNDIFTADFYPSYSEMMANISLVLYNKHFSERPVWPLVPALIEIGGILHKDVPDPLSEDIQHFLDDSPKGAIVFSVGSRTRGTELKPDKMEIFINVFSSLEQRVVWEWESIDTPPANFSNILFCTALQHEDTLAHRNIILSVTDGRWYRTSEAQRWGVPMIGVPLYADEIYSVAIMTSLEFGISIDINTIKETSFKESVIKVLSNPTYSRNVKLFSDLWRDRPISPKETAAFWLEYVIRHKGALHMQSALVHMNLIQRTNLDVIVVMLASGYVLYRLQSIFVQFARHLVLLRRCKLSKYKNH